MSLPLKILYRYTWNQRHWWFIAQRLLNGVGQEGPVALEGSPLLWVGEEEVEDVADQVPTATCPGSKRSIALPTIRSAVKPSLAASPLC
jgi:hypothetical protein